jgi:hypothetical protein
MGGNLSVEGVWSALMAASSQTAPSAPPAIGDAGARRTFERICGRLDGSRELVIALAAERSVAGSRVAGDGSKANIARGSPAGEPAARARRDQPARLVDGPGRDERSVDEGLLLEL